MFIYIYSYIYTCMCVCLFMWWIHRSSWVFIGILPKSWKLSKIPLLALDEMNQQLCIEDHPAIFREPMWYRQTSIKSDPTNEQGEIWNGIIELSNSKDLCMFVLSPFDTVRVQFDVSSVVATFSGFIFRRCVCLSSCPEKKNELQCALFLCLEVGLNIRPRGFEVIGIIRIHKDYFV